MTLSGRGIRPVLARRNTAHGSGLGVYRWVVERSLSWMHQARRLRVRYEKRDDMHEAFMAARCAMICWSLLHDGFVRGSNNLRHTRDIYHAAGGPEGNSRSLHIAASNCRSPLSRMISSIE